MLKHCLTRILPLPLALCAALAGLVCAASPVTLHVIANMSRYPQPFGLAEGSPGLFYSTAGTLIFSITSQGKKTALTTFPSGYNIQSQMVSGANGRIYSVVEYGGNPAELFSVDSAPGKVTYTPQDFDFALTRNLPDGTLLGVGLSLQSNQWGLFTADLNGQATITYQFPSGQRLPLDTAAYATDGNYYGISYLQDASGYLYRVTPSGSLTQLVNFPSGAFLHTANVPLLQANDGNLYGATPNGGANANGTIYKLTLAGQYTLLYTFPKGKNFNPTWLIEGSDGNLYGATLGVIADGGASELFRITTSGQYTPLVTMNFGSQGGCPCTLVQGSDGLIYGTALSGGVTGGGTIFSLDAGLPKPVPHAWVFQPRSGAPGTQVRIWGSDMLSATAAFNGLPAAAVSNSGPNYVLATVPEGATTGPITITTPGGTSATPGSFKVQ